MVKPSSRTWENGTDECLRTTAGTLTQPFYRTRFIAQSAARGRRALLRKRDDVKGWELVAHAKFEIKLKTKGDS